MVRMMEWAYAFPAENVDHASEWERPGRIIRFLVVDEAGIALEASGQRGMTETVVKYEDGLSEVLCGVFRYHSLSRRGVVVTVDFLILLILLGIRWHCYW